MAFTGRSLEPDWEWAHRELGSLPLASFEALLAMTFLYIIITSIMSFCMRKRRAKEKEIIYQTGELKKLDEEIKRLEAENGSSDVDQLKAKKDKRDDLSKTLNANRASYKPFNLNYVTIPHNLIMCLYSFYAFVGTSLVLFQNLKKSDFEFYKLFCDKTQSMKEGLDFWVYTFYLSKFFEYLDTIFLVLKAKPVMPPENSQYFLHIYHHAVTAAIVWTAMYFHLSTSWIGPVSNAFVHTLMYGYYFLAELNKIDRTLGGKFITPIQLIQFVFCMGCVLFESIQSDCGSHFWATGFLYANYLIFFVFFVKVWLDKKRERRQARVVTRKVSEEKKKE